MRNNFIIIINEIGYVWYWDLRERYNNEEGPVEALVLHEVSDEGDGLDCFAQTHLVSQDAIQVVVIK